MLFSPIISTAAAITVSLSCVQLEEQLHSNKVGIEKIKLLACKSTYLTNMNKDFENAIKLSPDAASNMIPKQAMVIVDADMFSPYSKHYLCIADYHGKFPDIKKTKDFSEDSLILACKIILQGMDYPRK